MNILKISRLFCLLGCLFVVACADDKGNYTYEDKAVITIDGISQMVAVLANAEYIDLKPVVTSNLEGTIDDRNTNFEFAYQRKNSEGKWVEVGNTKDLYMLAALDGGTHPFLFSVTDKRTEVKTLKLFYVNATSITSEGWMLLCNEGPEERVRLDMLAQISMDRIVPAYDVLRREEGVPEQHHAANIGYYATGGKTGNRIIAMSEDAAYWLETEDPKGGGSFVDVADYHELKASMFLTTPNDHIVNFVSVPISSSVLRKPEHDAVICVSREGNAYAWNTAKVETGFEYPINTSGRGKEPEYRVAPYVGTTLQRPVGSEYGSALLFDTDNHRFVYWSGEGGSDNNKQVLRPLEDPENKKFSYQTGNMDLVCMLSTTFSDGMVYSILSEGGKRHIYEVNLGGEGIRQTGCHLDVTAENFAEATCFAASSQYYVIYYAHGNKVYAYNLGSKTCKPVLTLEGEEITCLKFNHYDYPWGIDWLFSKYDDATRSVYRDRENQLIVASYKTSATNNNGGVLRFYDVSESGMGLTLKPGWEYTGYAKIKDIRYKEAR